MRRRLEASRVLYATECPSSLDTRQPGATSHSVMLELRSSTIWIGIISVALMSSPRNTEKWHSTFVPVRRVRDQTIGSSGHTEPLAPFKHTLAWRGPLKSHLACGTFADAALAWSGHGIIRCERSSSAPPVLSAVSLSFRKLREVHYACKSWPFEQYCELGHLSQRAGSLLVHVLRRERIQASNV